MKKQILILLLLSSTGIANASRMFGIFQEKEIAQINEDLCNELFDDEEDSYDELEDLEEEISDLKEEIKFLKREIASRPTIKYVEKPVVKYVEKPVVLRQRPVITRRLIYTRPVCYRPMTHVVYQDSCSTAVVSGLFGLGVGAALGAACSR